MSDSGNDHRLDRRRFGKILVAGVGGLSLAAIADAQAPDPPTTAAEPTGPNDFDVIIVGAGLSGLIAARELQRSRNFKKILILEAYTRIGGRMDGERFSFLNNSLQEETGYIDYGGQWVGPTQDAMLALVGQLRPTIPLFLSYEEGRSIQSWNPKVNERPVCADYKAADFQDTDFNGDVSDLYMGQCQPPDHFPTSGGKTSASCSKFTNITACTSNEKESAIWLHGLLEETSLYIPCDAPWNAQKNGERKAAEWDSKTFQQFLHDKNAEGYTQWLPTVAAHIGGSGGFEPDQVSLLHMAWTQHVAPQSETPEKWLLKGGAGQIPEILKKEITEQNTPPVDVRINHPVMEIKHGSGTNGNVFVEVKVQDGSAYTAKAVIVAIPPPMRQKINFPDLSKNYIGFMYGSPMGSMSKVHAVYDYAFWRMECFSGSAAGNLKTCEFIADSGDFLSPGILTSFIAADRNVGLRHATFDQVKELVLDDYVQYFHFLKSSDKDMLRHPRKFFYRNWDNEPWIGGAFTSYPRPGVWTRYGEEGWRTPSGLIFWAGTETSERWPGYFDGAIRAGVRASEEVLAKLKLAPPPPLNPPWPKPSCPSKVERIK